MIEELNLDREAVFGLLSGRVSTAINRALYRNFRSNDIGITPEQWTVLLSLSDKDGITQQDLATATFRDKPSITRLIDNLEKLQLVRRETDVKDKRINLIYLTELGIEVNKKARIVSLGVMQDSLKGISEEEIHRGEQTLKKILKNLL